MVVWVVPFQVPFYLDPELGVSTFMGPTALRRQAEAAAKQALREARAKESEGSMTKMTDQLFANRKSVEGDKVSFGWHDCLEAWKYWRSCVARNVCSVAAA